MNLNPPGYRGPNQQPLPGQPPGYAPGVAFQSTTSAMAKWSMILGLASLALIFFCLGFITAPLAIIFGIIGIVAVSKGQGQVKGKGMALTGIICGVASLAIYGLFIVNIAKRAKDLPPAEVTQRSLLSSAESKVISSSKGAAHGNSAEAKKIAEDFSSTIKTMHSAFFEREGDAPAISLTDGEFVTYCELSDAGCAFIVHVPEYRKHTGDAKDELADLAWIVATTVAATHPESIPAGSPLGVGLRGTILYGDVLTGKAGDEEPSTSSSKGEDLLPFFIVLEKIEPAAEIEELTEEVEAGDSEAEE